VQLVTELADRLPGYTTLAARALLPGGAGVPAISPVDLGELEQVLSRITWAGVRHHGRDYSGCRRFAAAAMRDSLLAAPTGQDG
jgi:hypothetical protein